MKKQISKAKILRNKFYDNNKLNLTMAIMGTTVLSIAILCVPYLMQQIIDFISGTSKSDWRHLFLIGIAIIFMELFSGICTYYFRTSFSTKAVAQYRDYAFSEFLNKNIQSFHKKSSSTYMSALVNDISSIKEKYLDMIPIISQILICCFGAIVMMASYNIKLTIIAVIISLIPLIASLMSGKKLSNAEVSLSEKNSGYIAVLKDIFGGFSTIKSFKAESAFYVIHNKQCEDVRKSQKNREKILERVNYTAAISGYITLFSMLFACVLFSFYDDTITAGTIIAFSQLMNYLIDPVTNLPPMLADAKASLSLVDKLGDILDNEEKQETSTKLSRLNNSIKLRNVSYSYVDKFSKDTTEVSLKNINLDLKRGKCYVIVGASGSGKSTLLKLIMQMFNSYNGEILYDNINLRNVSDDEVYKSLAYIQQETVIFDTSILNNITMYQNFSKDEIDTVIKQSGLTDIINQRGIDYECGENGSFLSGGERQRIAIARSLIRHTNVLLADEITASLDTNTSFHVMSSIIALKDITRVLVLHDLDENILTQADEIITLKNGCIKEKGAFKELIDKKGYFYSLFTISSN